MAEDKTYPSRLVGSESYVSSARGGPTYVDRDDLVARANLIDVRTVLLDFHGLDVPPMNSWKVDCPYSFEHGDGGTDKNCRMYDMANALYCFAMHGMLTPVRLTVLRTDLRQREAATELLQHYGKLKGRGYRARYEEVLQEMERRREGDTNVQVLVEALHVALAKEPTFFRRQFDADVREELTSAMDRLSEMARGASKEELRKWLTESSQQVRSCVNRKVE